MEVTLYTTDDKIHLDKNKLKMEDVYDSTNIPNVIRFDSNKGFIYVKKEPGITAESIKAFFETNDEPEKSEDLVLEKIDENTYKIDENIVMVDEPGVFKKFQFYNDDTKEACQVLYNSSFNRLSIESIKNNCKINIEPASKLID